MSSDPPAELRPEPLFVPPGHYYSPLPTREHARAAVARAATLRPQDVKACRLDDRAMRRLWRRLAALMPRTATAADRPNGRRYRDGNDFFATGDALVYGAMIQHFRPMRLLEIGSGHTSALALDLRERCGRPRDLTFVDPEPDRLLGLIGQPGGDGVTVLAQEAQTLDRRLFRRLRRNDILFIDSSHVAKIGSDVCFLLFEVLPYLRPGVIVHFHDVFWPFEYPEDWAVEEMRSWNEIYFLRAFLMYNRAFEILFFNDYFGRWHADAGKQVPLFAEHPGASLWLRRKRTFGL